MVKQIGISLLGSAIAAINILAIKPAAAQLMPQPWASLGVQDSELTYSVGVRALGFGAELGVDNENAVGVDVLKFISPPFISVISGYGGVGLYEKTNSDGSEFAYSAGVQIRPDGNFFFGAGYHNIRGFNGQIGFKLF
jgi:hypothetical protein